VIRNMSVAAAGSNQWSCKGVRKSCVIRVVNKQVDQSSSVITQFLPYNHRSRRSNTICLADLGKCVSMFSD
jgi:hypothetical protein